MSADAILREREKELACMHAISLLGAEAPEPRKAATGIARALRDAMSDGQRAYCSVSLDSGGAAGAFSVSSGRKPAGESIRSIEEALPEDPSIGWRGGIRLEYGAGAPDFLPQEKALLRSVVAITASVLRTSSLIARLRASSESLGAKNVALREIVSMIEDERKETLRSFRHWLASDIIPLAERARDPSLSPAGRSSYVELLAAELGRGVAELGPGPARDPTLSQREREVAVQVRNGRTSKEIAALLGISPATVERHRHNIRRKLRVTDRGVNLSGLLSDSPPVGS